MDTIRFLLRYLVKFTFILFAFVIVWWLFTIIFPNISIRSLLSTTGTSTQKVNWLPAPGSVKGLFGEVKTPSAKNNVYVAGQPYNGNGNAYGGNQGGSQVDFITYTSEGAQITHGGGAVFNGQQQISQSTTTQGYAQKSLYIRNLSIYEGGYVYTGLSFTGEARESMFQNGKFPVVVADQLGRAVLISYAEATTNWTVPGWVRFQVRMVGVMPSKVPCTMIFQQELSQQLYEQKRQPVLVAIPVLCN